MCVSSLAVGLRAGGSSSPEQWAKSPCIPWGLQLDGQSCLHSPSGAGAPIAALTARVCRCGGTPSGAPGYTLGVHVAESVSSVLLQVKSECVLAVKSNVAVVWVTARAWITGGAHAGAPSGQGRAQVQAARPLRRCQGGAAFSRLTAVCSGRAEF